MGTHRSGGAVPRWAVGVAVLAALVVGTLLIRADFGAEPLAGDGADRGGGRSAGDQRPDGDRPDVQSQQAGAGCAQMLRVVTASSFAPVLTALAPEVGSGDACARLAVERVDGQAAVARVQRGDFDLWVPDDAAWAWSLPAGRVAPPGTIGSGNTVATSPIYMVTDPVTAGRVSAAGGSWRALARLLTGRLPRPARSARPAGQPAPAIRLAVRDPASSGDGLVAAGAVAEAVWLDGGGRPSAPALAGAVRMSNTVAGPQPALPNGPGEVGLVPEYALLPHLGAANRRFSLLAGTDHAALLHHTWLPAVDAVRDPVRANALMRLLGAVTGPASQAAIAAARLRGPRLGAPPPGGAPLPGLAGAEFETLDAGGVRTVVAAWAAADRRATAVRRGGGDQTRQRDGRGAPNGGAAPESAADPRRSPGRR